MLSSSSRARLRARMVVPALLQRPSSVYPFSLPYDLAGASDLIADAAVKTNSDIVILPTTLVHLAPRLAAAGVLVIGDAADIVSQPTLRMLAYGRSAPWEYPILLLNYLATRSQAALASKIRLAPDSRTPASAENPPCSGRM
jgi:hypothetical protein